MDSTAKRQVIHKAAGPDFLATFVALENRGSSKNMAKLTLGRFSGFESSHPDFARRSSKQSEE